MYSVRGGCRPSGFNPLSETRLLSSLSSSSALFADSYTIYIYICSSVPPYSVHNTTVCRPEVVGKRTSAEKRFPAGVRVGRCRQCWVKRGGGRKGRRKRRLPIINIQKKGKKIYLKTGIHVPCTCRDAQVTGFSEAVGVRRVYIMSCRL